MADDVGSEISYEDVTRNHEEIRRWARQHGGRPAKHADTPDAVDEGDDADDTEELALQFPGEDDAGLVQIEWEEFFERF